MVYLTERAVGWQDKEGRQIMGVTPAVRELIAPQSQWRECGKCHRANGGSVESATEPMERVHRANGESVESANKGR